MQLEASPSRVYHGFGFFRVVALFPSWMLPKKSPATSTYSIPCDLPNVGDEIGAIKCPRTH